eukprot:14052786-Ditylum_brightwellii.AAC.1
MTADLKTLFPPVTSNPQVPLRQKCLLTILLLQKMNLIRRGNSNCQEEFLPTPPDTPPPYPAPALEEYEDKGNKIIMKTQEEKEEPLKSADQSISMNLGSTTESTLDFKCFGKYVNMMDQLRDTQYRAQRRAADKIQQLQKAME